jgi:methylmalonyl-CoA/ethylmalonyl-CoA epimerase
MINITPHHVGISVADLEASIAWYEAMLGFVVEQRVEIAAIPARIAFLKRGAFRIELFEVAGAAPLPDDRRVPNKDLHTHGTKHLAFSTPNVPALLQELKARGADVAMEAIIQGNPVAFVRDNTGNLIEFVTEAAFQ